METGALLLDENFLPAAINLISKAEKLIYISTFKAEMTTKPRGRKLHKLFELLFEKSQLGIDVRLLISKRENYGHIPVTNLFAIRDLKANGVKVRHLRNDRLCHAKILLVDDYAAIIGSHNLSIKSCHSNFEVSYYVHTPTSIDLLYNVYLKVWNTAKEG